jgi:hypothetical protein
MTSHFPNQLTVFLVRCWQHLVSALVAVTGVHDELAAQGSVGAVELEPAVKY